MIYASAYQQTGNVVLLCVSVIDGLMREKFLHAELTGALIAEGQPEIKDYSKISIIGLCDGSCSKKEAGRLGVMLVGKKLALEICGSKAYKSLFHVHRRV